MIMIRLFQDKSLMVKLAWRVVPKISMTSRVLWFSNIFIQFSDHKSFLFIIDLVLYFVPCFFCNSHDQSSFKTF